jgi:hypothetical protein
MTGILKVDKLQKSDGTDGVHIAGHVIQTQTGVFTSVVNTTSGSYTSLISANITPKFASSNILIMAAIGGLYMNTSGGSNQHHWRMARTVSGGSTVGVTGQNTNFHTEMGRGFTTAGMRANVNMNIIDSPNTTSQIAYDVQVSLFTGSGGIQINDTSGTSTIILMEIAQ